MKDISQQLFAAQNLYKETSEGELYSSKTVQRDSNSQKAQVSTMQC